VPPVAETAPPLPPVAEAVTAPPVPETVVPPVEPGLGAGWRGVVLATQPAVRTTNNAVRRRDGLIE
jgi:hypothetical protein